MQDTLYKTDNAKCSQLWQYKKGRLESIVCGIHHVSVRYDAVCCDGAHCDITHPDSAHVETAF